MIRHNWRTFCWLCSSENELKNFSRVQRRKYVTIVNIYIYCTLKYRCVNNHSFVLTKHLVLDSVCLIFLTFCCKRVFQQLSECHCWWSKGLRRHMLYSRFRLISCVWDLPIFPFWFSCKFLGSLHIPSFCDSIIYRYFGLIIVFSTMIKVLYMMSAFKNINRMYCPYFKFYQTIKCCISRYRRLCLFHTTRRQTLLHLWLTTPICHKTYGNKCVFRLFWEKRQTSRGAGPLIPFHMFSLQRFLGPLRGERNGVTRLTQNFIIHCMRVHW